MKRIDALLIILCSTLLMLASCGGGGGSGGGSSTATTNPPATGSTKVIDLGSETTFTIQSDAISFLVSASGGTASNIRFNSLITPKGDDLIKGDLAGLIYGSKGYGNVLLPLVPKNSSMEGLWQFSTTGGFDKVKLTLRTGPPPTSSTLAIKPYLTGTKYAPSDINSALAVLKSIYEKAGLQVVLDAVTVISEEKFTTVSTNFTEANTAALVSRGVADRINLFFVEDFAGAAAGVVGIAPHIPGSLGIPGSYNGVLNNLNAHVIDGALSIQLLGETAAHEMGHWLGLFHTTEREGRVFDPLADTPECPISNAALPYFGVQVSDCKELDGSNLMFWQGSHDIDQSTLTPNQVHIINYSPIAQQ